MYNEKRKVAELGLELSHLDFYSSTNFYLKLYKCNPCPYGCLRPEEKTFLILDAPAGKS